MKILGIIAGRTKGATELLAKQALAGAREAGAQTELVNLSQIKLLPCIGCGKCHDMGRAYFGNCPLPDDFHWLEEKILDADGLVVAMPCYEKMPPSEYKVLMDRTGPANDVYFRLVAKEKRTNQPRLFTDDYQIDERTFKTRYVSFISHGGTNWTELGPAVLVSWSTSMGYTPVDLLDLQWNLGIAFQTEVMERVYRSGAHVAKCCRENKAEYIGEKGQCPVCHSKTLNLGAKADEAQCAVCGVYGTLVIDEGGTLRMQCTPEQLKGSTMQNTGRKQHYDDMMSIFAKMGTFDWPKYKEVTEQIFGTMQTSVPGKEPGQKA